MTNGMKLSGYVMSWVRNDKLPLKTLVFVKIFLTTKIGSLPTRIKFNVKAKANTFHRS